MSGIVALVRGGPHRPPPSVSESFIGHVLLGYWAICAGCGLCGGRLWEHRHLRRGCVLSRWDRSRFRQREGPAVQLRRTALSCWESSIFAGCFFSAVVLP